MNQPTKLNDDDDAPTLLRFAPAAQASVSEDWVVLVHGLFASRRSMRQLQSRMQLHGYRVCNWGYSSWLQSTQQHIDRLVPQVQQLQELTSVRSISFVTHSMGGILVRAALQQTDIAKINRIVMLSPPNRGSHLTRLPSGPIAWLVPAIADLSREAGSLPNRLPPLPEIEVGVIAATRDLIVRVEDTLLVDQKDHCVVSTTHFRLPQNSEAIDKSLCFLQHGNFSAAKSAAA